MASRRVVSSSSFFRRFLDSPDTWPVVGCVTVALGMLTYTVVNKSLHTPDVRILPHKRSDPFYFLRDPFPETSSVEDDAQQIKDDLDE